MQAEKLTGKVMDENSFNENSPSKPGKKVYIWVALALFLFAGLGIGLLEYNLKNSLKTGPPANNSAEVQNQDSLQMSESTSTPTPTPVKSSSGPARLNYGDAIAKYLYRIQFVDCHGNPGSLSFKVGTPLMLDNRDPKPHTVKVAGKTYSLKAYDYAIATISKAGEYNLTCDGGGSALVNVEK